MEFRDLKAQYEYLKGSIDQAMINVMSQGTFIGGKPVQELEEKLASYVGVKHCITCANGTDALQLALMAWNIGSGDAVFVPDFTFFSTAEVVALVGATPVFVDVDKDTYNIDVECLEKAVKRVVAEGKYNPKVIIPVDLFGQPADYDRIRIVADRYDLLVLEDGAQGFGGRIGDRKACSFGDISATSFFPAKPLGCYGDGGAIFTDNDEWAELIKSLKVHGKGSDKYDNVRIGLNSRLDTIQAAVLLEKLNHFIGFEIDKCNYVAKCYSEALKDIVKVPVVQEGNVSSWAQYTIQLDDAGQREKVIQSLKEAGVPSAVYYSKPLHKQKAFENQYSGDEELLNTCKLSNTVLSLPMHSYLSDEEIDQIVKVIEEIIKK